MVVTVRREPPNKRFKKYTSHSPAIPALPKNERVAMTAIKHIKIPLIHFLVLVCKICSFFLSLPFLPFSFWFLSGFAMVIPSLYHLVLQIFKWIFHSGVPPKVTTSSIVVALLRLSVRYAPLPAQT